MNDLIRLVDNSIPGLGGADLLRLARLRPGDAEFARGNNNLRRDIGLDRDAS